LVLLMSLNIFLRSATLWTVREPLIHGRGAQLKSYAAAQALTLIIYVRPVAVAQRSAAAVLMAVISSCRLHPALLLWQPDRRSISRLPILRLGGNL
jgi:hypothetical protein